MSTTNREPTDVIPQSALAEASAWITRLHGPGRSPQLEAGLRGWLQADPMNGRAFESMTEIWDWAGAASIEQAPRRQRHSESFRLARAAAIAGIFVALAFGGYRLATGDSYSTGIGEQRSVSLDDGSRVSLNSGSRVVLEFSDTQRRVVLKRGEAYFEVSPDATRPFIVLAGDHRVTALGTAFDVRYETERVAITLVSGKVAVDAVDSRQVASPVRILEPGERLIVSGGKVANVDKPSTDTVTAWRRGEVVMDGTPLADAVAEMNRHDRQGIVIDDPAAAALKVSGLYRTGDSMGFARAAAEAYDLEITERDGRIHLRQAPVRDAAGR